MNARIRAALDAVHDSGRHLASDLPTDQRHQAARDHQNNLLNLAYARADAGTATYSDQRAIATAKHTGGAR